jgi:hypothetical protein
VPRADPAVPQEALRHAYAPGPADEFKVRCGPNYKKTGLKQPSLESFYEIAAFDFFKTERV